MTPTANISFTRFYREMVERLPPNGLAVEVGSFQGRSAIYFAQVARELRKQVTLYCVDRWDKVLGAPRDKPHHEAPGAYQRFIGNVRRAKVREYILPIPSDSVAAAPMFTDGTVDFVFIDAGHSADQVEADVHAWLPKVKPGGVIAGHDWGRFGVTEGVLRVLPLNQLEIRPEEFCWVHYV